MKRRTNFDLYLEEQLKDSGFAGRFKKAGEAWDVALRLARRESRSYEPASALLARIKAEPSEKGINLGHSRAPKKS